MNTKTAGPKLVGLLGIMGSGKSTVAAQFASYGARVIDADKIAVELQQPGQPVQAAMVGLMGQAILNTDGTLNRQKAAKLMFADDNLLQKVEDIVHPAVLKIINQEIMTCSATDIVVLDAAVLLMRDRINVPTVICVDCPAETAVNRMVKMGFSQNDIKSRISKQMSREQMTRSADYIIHNIATLEELDNEIRQTWQWITSYRV